MAFHYYYQDVGFTSTIENIYHISDIHIHLNSRHNEYQSVFNKLYDDMNVFVLKKSKNVKDVVCVITGDILHSKTELLPECIEFTRKFFMDIARIMPLIIIAGNHDMNVNNDNRLDAITPIRNGIPVEYPIYYLEKTGVYRFGNVLFSLASVRDYIIIPAETIVRNEDDTVIALYHGRINGAQLFNGIKVDGEINRKTNKTITTSCFIGYDMVLMGDIHLQQFFNIGNGIKNGAYSGSLIQQNHGENRNGHGYIIWNIQSRKGIFSELESSYGFISITLKNGKMMSDTTHNNICFKDDLDFTHSSTCNIPKHIHLRLLLNETSNLQVQEFISVFKLHHNILDITYQEIDVIKCENKNGIGGGGIGGGGDDDIVGNEGNEGNGSYASLKITNPEYQNGLIEEYLKDDGCPNDIIEHIKKLNTTANETLEKTEYLNDGNGWKLISLEFSNLFSFGNDNKIDFSNYKGIVGIIAPNHYGKSSILDIILFTLFDKVPRKGTVKDIVNNRRNSFYSKLVFNIGIWNYIVEKSGNVNNLGKSTMKAKFYRFNPLNNHKEILDEDTVVRTKNIILKYVGDFEDMIQTNISLQNNNCIFIDAENTVRRKELERIIQIDFLEGLTKVAASNMSEKKAVLKHLNNKSPVDVSLVLEKNIITVENKLKDARIRHPKLELKKDEILMKIKDIQMKLIPGVEDKYISLLNSIGIENKNKNKDKDNNDLDIKKIDKEFQNELKDLETQKLKIIGKLSFKYTTFEKAEKFINNFDDLKIKLNDDRIEYLKKIKIFEKQLEDAYNSKKHIDFNIYGCDKNNISSINEMIENKTKSIIVLQEFKRTTETTIHDLEGKLKDLIELKNKKMDIENHDGEKIPIRFINFLDETPIIELKEKFNIKYNMFLDFLKPHKRKNGLDITVNELLELKNNINIYEYLNQFRHLGYCSENENENKLDCIENIQSELEDAKNELKDLDEQIQNINNWINKANNWIEITKWNLDIDNSIKNIKMNKELLEAQINNINSKHKMMDEDILNLKSITICDTKLKEVLGRYESYKSSIKMNKDTLDELKNDCNENKINLRALDIEDVRLKEVNELIMVLNKEIISFENSIISYTEKLNIVKDEIKTIKILEKELIVLGYYVDALKNLPYIIISKVVPLLEKKINQFLSNTTDFIIKVVIEGMRIDLYLDRPIYNGKMILLNNASGYERFISSMGIRLALMEISQLPKPNFIAIDEGWTSFDFNNLHNVGIVFDYLVNKFDFIINISHLQSIREHCHYHLNLKKDKDGFSCIE